MWKAILQTTLEIERKEAAQASQTKEISIISVKLWRTEQNYFGLNIFHIP